MRLRGRHVETGEPVEVTLEGTGIAAVGPAPDETAQAPGVLGDDGYWLAPALFDSQVNGFRGCDLNAAGASPDHLATVIRLLWEAGVARCCPTVTTNSFERMAGSLRAMRQACETDAQVDYAAVAFHIEGPYISPEDGPRGAHPREHARLPDMDEFHRLQDAAGGRIRYVTLAPELPGAFSFIEQLAQEGMVMALGHHAGSADEIRAAVDAGARHCTHLGNGAHAQLPRHPNYIWEQLAEDRLSAGIIVDGHHLPPSVVKTFVRAKGLERTILVSDAIAAAGLPPGRYSGNHDQALEITSDGRIQLADTPYLAGSGLRLHEGVGNAVRFSGISLAQAMQMATRNPAQLFGIDGTYGHLRAGQAADLLLFHWDPAVAPAVAPAVSPVVGPAVTSIEIVATIAGGRLVYQAGVQAPRQATELV